MRFTSISPKGPSTSSRRGCARRFDAPYESGKWECSAALEVPLNLVMAYALLRDDPAWAEAGSLLGDPAPERTVATKLLRASAEYVRMQPEEFSEDSLHVYRGMLTVARLVHDQDLERDALSRLETFIRRGFYHDGVWRQPQATAHRRVVGFPEGWASSLTPSEPEGMRPKRAVGPGQIELPAPASGSTSGLLPWRSEVSRRSGRVSRANRSSTSLFLPAGGDVGGPAGHARWRRESHGWRSARRKIPWRSRSAGLIVTTVLNSGAALRLVVSGVPLLDDLDDEGRTASGYGWRPSHNTVLVDGLNQRETPV